MKKTSPTNSLVQVVDLAASVSEIEFDLEKSVNAKPLFKILGMQILLIALDAQAELKKHSATGPISVQVLKGSISFIADKSEYNLTSGQLLTLEGNVPHSVYAKERSIFLVTKSIPE